MYSSKLAAVLLLLFFTFQQLSAQRLKNNCPDAAGIKPCVCNPKFDGSCMIRCYAVNTTVLRTLGKIPNLCNGHVHLTLVHSVASGIPTELWKKLLSSKSVDVSLMFSTVKNMIPPGDEPLPDLHTPGEAYIKFQHSATLQDWDWEQLKNFVADDELTLVLDDTLLPSIPQSFSEIAKGAVEKLYIDNAQLTNIPSGIFKNFDLLYSLSLQGNNITEIKRSMLPQPAAKLRFLHLNGNDLTEVPSDLLEDMPSLEVVYLRENKLTTLPVDFFQSINSPKLQRLDLIQNRWHCDCRLQNAVQSTNIPLEMGTCTTPDELAGKDVKTAISGLTCT